MKEGKEDKKETEVEESGATGIEKWRIENTRMEGYGIQLVEKNFLSCLLRNDGRIVMAYREAFPDAVKDVSAKQMLRRGRMILKRGRVQEYMKQMLKSKEVGPEYVLGGIMEIAQGGSRDMDRLKAYELLGKFLKMFQSEGSTKNIYNLNIGEDTATRLLERRGKYEIGGRGDFIDVRGDEGVGSNGAGEDGDIVDGEEEFD